MRASDARRADSARRGVLPLGGLHPLDMGNDMTETGFAPEWPTPIRDMSFDRLNAEMRDLVRALSLFRRINQPAPELVHRQVLAVRNRLDAMRGVIA